MTVRTADGKNQILGAGFQFCFDDPGKFGCTDGLATLIKHDKYGPGWGGVFQQ